MDSTLDVALAAKLLKLFPPSDDKFLTFPLTGLAFAEDELDFLKDPSELDTAGLRTQIAHRSQFAQLLNQIPADSLVYDAGEAFLWDEYERVLRQATLADSLLTDAEKAELEQADEFLTDVETVDGEETTVYSKAVQTYYELREAHEELERTYLDEKLTVDTSDDKELKIEWETKRDEELKNLKEKALNDWITLGRKDEVERWQGIKARLSGKIPRLYVEQYLSDLEASHQPAGEHDPVGSYSTFYSPSDSFDPDAPWAKLHLDKDEIDSLVKEAPEELKRFAGGDIAGIESVTMEYAKIVIMRPWFEPSFLRSPYWKLAENEIVSDGKVPRGGRLPSFVTYMIVTRNIEIERMKTAAKKPAAMRLALVAPALRRVRHKLETKETGRRAIVKRGKPKREPRKARRRDHRNRAKGVVAVARPRPPRRNLQAVLRAKALGTSVKRRSVIVPARRPRPQPKPERVVEKLQLDGVAVLAFVCRRTPECPKPDPGLDWD